jgi:hypothetical protein
MIRRHCIGLCMVVLALSGAAAARDLSGWRGHTMVADKGTTKAAAKKQAAKKVAAKKVAAKKAAARRAAVRKSARKQTVAAVPIDDVAPPPATGGRSPCMTALARANVPARATSPRPGIQEPVEVLGPIAGVEYHSLSSKSAPLILDCSLVEALDEAGPLFRDEGIKRANYSASYQIRNVRGTNQPSKHSYGLALDVHTFVTDQDETLSVLDDYEQGLGDELDCIGAPDTDAARALRTLYCRFTLGPIFHLVLGPDDNADHHNHFHLEAPPWDKRKPRSPMLSPRQVAPPSGGRLRGSTAPSNG